MTSLEKFKALNINNIENRNCNLLVLNHNELLYVFENNGKDIFFSEDANKTKSAIWKFNIKQNNWIRWIEFPADCVSSWSLHTSSLDLQNMILYIFDESGHILQIDLNTKEITQFKTDYNKSDDPLYLKSLFIDNQLHIFSRWKEFEWTHHVWDNESRDLTLKFKFSACSIDRYRDAEVMYLSSQKTILIWPTSSDTLYFYSLMNNNFIRKKINGAILKNPRLTTDEKYIICLEYSELNIMNLATMHVYVYENAVDKRGHVCIKDDAISKELVTSGYIRRCWCLSEFKNIGYPPVYLIKIMETYINFEVMYNLEDDGLYRIKVDDILSGMIPVNGNSRSEKVKFGDPNYFIIEGALLTYNGQHVIIKEVDKLKNICSIALPSTPLEIYKSGVPLENIIHSVSAENMSGAKIKVVYGEFLGQIGSLGGIDNQEAVISLTSETDLKIIDKSFIVIYID